MDRSSSKHHDDIKSQFSIRLTISNNSQNLNNIEDCSSSSESEDSPARPEQKRRSRHGKVLEIKQKQNETIVHQPSCRHHQQNQRQETTSEIAGGQNLIANKKRSYRFIEPQNHHQSALFVNLSDRSSSCSSSSGFISGNNSCNNTLTSDNSKSSTENKQLFISPDLNTKQSPSSSNSSSSSSTCSGSISCGSPPTQIDFADSSYELLEPASENNNNNSNNNSRESTMSHSCNFMYWMQASRRRASSVTPGSAHTSTTTTSSSTAGGNQAGQQNQDQTSVAQRRASSSNELTNGLEVTENSLLARSSSGNHLAINASVETVCGSDHTTTNNTLGALNYNDRHAAYHNNHSMKPLEIEIDSPQMDDEDGSHHVLTSAANTPLSLEDILQIDMDNLRLDEECRALEAEAQFWEQKVEELERRQFAEDVPRTLVDSIIRARKEVRDLEFQLYKQNLAAEEMDAFSDGNWNQTSTATGADAECLSLRDIQDDDDEMYYTNENNGDDDVDDRMVMMMMSNKMSTNTTNVSASSRYVSDDDLGKFGSHLKPGDENTADILNAIPPSGSFQHRHFLQQQQHNHQKHHSKPTSGTDTSEHSQLPTFHHHHNHQQQQHRSRHTRRQHHQQQQLYVQLDSQSKSCASPAMAAAAGTGKQQQLASRASPIRPNHFKCEFRSPQQQQQQQQMATTLAQDSSSTASSSSPQ